MPATKRTRPARQIAEVPRDERPRERLLRNGAQSLSDAELLAVVLKNGLGWGSALGLTRDLLTDTGGLAGLTVASALSLRRQRRQGVGDIQLAALLAAVELACRMAEARIPDRELLNRPTRIARYVALRYGSRDQEVLGAIFVDTRNRLLGEREIYRGYAELRIAEAP
jgi:DNA repair protein RadC